MKKLIILLILIIGLTGCNLYSTIEQEVRIDSYIENTFVVTTHVWICKGLNSISIEESFYAFDVPYNKVKIITRIQYNKALKIKNIIESHIKENLIAR